MWAPGPGWALGWGAPSMMANFMWASIHMLSLLHHNVYRDIIVFVVKMLTLQILVLTTLVFNYNHYLVIWFTFSQVTVMFKALILLFY